MRIIIIRHGEPDNPNQTLTKKGFEEVNALGEFYRDLKFKDAYSSPLARAKLTAEGFLSYHNNINATILPWLEEFPCKITPPYLDKKIITWDYLPSYFTKQEEFYDNNKYLDHPLFEYANVKEKYNEVVTSFDDLLKNYGYERDGRIYKVTQSNRDTIILFCHLGIMSIIMSHIMNIPYILIAQHFVCPPSGVTILTSEERENGIAQFRCSQYGDISHLNAKNLTPSFHGRFCETFDSDERH